MATVNPHDADPHYQRADLPAAASVLGGDLSGRLRLILI
jgi:hypothetical protein